MTLRSHPKLQKIVLLGILALSSLHANLNACAQTEDSRSTQEGSQPSFLSFARFKIPFNVDSQGSNIREVQLWVSTDQGKSWQMHGSATPDAKHFEFQAAAEGLYFFSVQTVDYAGEVYPSPNPYLQVFVDTSKPQAALRVDVSPTGQLVVDIRAADDNLLPESATLRYRTDRSPEWRSAEMGAFGEKDGIFQTQTVLQMLNCREVVFAFTVADQARNMGEATFRYVMPRTATGESDMTLASGGSRVPTIQNAVPWTTSESNGSSPSPFDSPDGPGQLISRNSENLLSLEPGNSHLEELPTPSPVSPKQSFEPPAEPEKPDSDGWQDNRPEEQVDGPSGAYHCNSRAFSLDYSVEALGGTTLSDVELWGTEDGGRTWQKWGGDPDRQSPFDVQVGNDGLFGFRMVIVASNGMVSNRPKEGDSADMWINVDTSEPTAKIKRALYGQGDEEGMLVIDYSCSDGHLVDRPISLSYSESADGPWTRIAGGLANSGIYLWKSTPNLPAEVFLKLEVVDKAGNVGTHRMEVPISTKGLGPRGRIQGIRPIAKPQP